jgi:NitT/TauT family transport system substrate-binding protein
LFDVQDNLTAFKSAKSYESLKYTGGKTATFLKKLDMISEKPNVSQLLEPKFVKKAAKR